MITVSLGQELRFSPAERVEQELQENPALEQRDNGQDDEANSDEDPVPAPALEENAIDNPERVLDLFPRGQ